MSEHPYNPENTSEQSGHRAQDDEMMCLELDIWHNIEHKIRRQARRKAFLKINSAICVLLLLAAVVFYHQYQKVTWITVTANAGSMKRIELPDSSVVWLNAGSVLRYPSKFRNQRNIELVEGEAYFDVRHYPAKPFIVHYGNMHTAVLGTAFNIQFYKKLPNVRITVIRGKVEVGDQKQSYGMLIRNQQIELHRQDHKRTLSNVDADKISDWKSSRVNLYNAPFDELVLRIENSFNVHISYNPSRFSNLTTIHYSSAYRLEDVLRMISDIHALSYQINGKEVRFEKR